MFKCEVVNIGGTYMDPLSIHTTMTILNLLRLFWSLCPHGHTSFSLYRLSVTGLLRSMQHVAAVIQ